ncbi:MAG TPA: hypothetical protein ENH29_05275, partial [Bacteroidetes bacterium]|nr:hypothetical protein [Bacteroidota bacterium]
MIYDGLMMKNKWLLLFGMVFCFTTISFAQPRFIYNPVFFARADQPIEISIRIDGNVSASDEMRIYFRTKGNESYDYIVSEKYGEEFRGSIPAQSASVGKIEYFFTFLYGGNIYTLPESNPYYEPFEIQITPVEPGNTITVRQPVSPLVAKKPRNSGNLLSLSTEKYLILSPENEERLMGEDVVIAVSLFFETGEIDIYKTKLLLDGRQVKPELSENLITYVPPHISEGRHEVDLNFIRSDGKEYEPVRRRFQVMSARRGGMVTLPFVSGASGNIYAESRSESYSGIRQNTNLTGGRLRGKTGFLHYGTRFYITSLENKNFQPRNRFLFWVEAKFFNLYGGDTSPRFSELILYGKRIRGFNVQLNLKLINFDFVMGQTYRSVKGISLNQLIIDPATQDTSYYNPATGDTVQNPISRYGTYDQNLLGLKVTFGRRRGSHLGFSAIKVKDDINSIQSGLKPKDNVVVGSDLQIAMFSNRFRWKTEGAFSILTDDISGGSLTKSNIDSLTGES